MFSQLIFIVNWILTLIQTGKGSFWLHFARQVTSGDFDEHATFLGLIEHFVERNRRITAGKSTRGLVVPPAFHQLCNAVSLVSNSAYKLIKGSLGGPDVRTLRYV